VSYNSIFNHVLGPVMRGPSSSHTAASHRIATIAVGLFGEQPVVASFKFDDRGSYGQVYDKQGADLAFTCGLLGIPLEDKRFFEALRIAASRGLEINFDVGRIESDDHPNSVEISLDAASGRRMELTAKSIGGGMFEITRIDGIPVGITGAEHHLSVVMEKEALPEVDKLLSAEGWEISDLRKSPLNETILVLAKRARSVEPDFFDRLGAIRGIIRATNVPPVFYPIVGRPLFSSAVELLELAESRGCSLGRLALEYEAELLGISEQEAVAEMGRRLDIMTAAVEKGLSGREGELRMHLLEPSAHKIFAAEGEGKVAVGGLHTRAAARAMAALHVNSAMGVVCAAPTGGSAGVIPGVIVTLMEEKGLSREKAISALFVASAIGLIILNRGTFAAEEAGCQVEIGAAGAMAAAMVVEAGGGTVGQALDAAAISLQNTLGMPCDLVQGAVEIPCHTRNAVAASSAFVCADLILGGYVNHIPLDETIDASIAAGRSLPSELRCTARGGLATAPSARALPKKL
jgi:L-serine dehydratase